MIPHSWSVCLQRLARCLRNTPACPQSLQHNIVLAFMHRSVLSLLVYLLAVILGLTNQAAAAPLVQNRGTTVSRGTQLLKNVFPKVDEPQNIIPRQYVSQNARLTQTQRILTGRDRIHGTSPSTRRRRRIETGMVQDRPRDQTLVLDSLDFVGSKHLLVGNNNSENARKPYRNDETRCQFISSVLFS